MYELPGDVDALMAMGWAGLAPFYDELASREFDAASVDTWMADWSRLTSVVEEANAVLYLNRSRDTTDATAEQRFFRFIEEIRPHSEVAEQRLREKLLNSGLTPNGMTVPLRRLRAQAELFRAENVPLLTELSKLATQYDKLVGAQTIAWQGEQLTIERARQLLAGPDREQREQAWRSIHSRQLQDRSALNELWAQLFALRAQIAANAGHASFREYIWARLSRFDYTPEDCAAFREAIAAVVVPAATRIYERHRQRLGVERLRPWDLVDGSFGRPAAASGETPLEPFADVEALTAGGVRMLGRVDEELGAHLELMAQEGLLDLANRPGKAPGGYCTYFAVRRRPFIFMNAVGSQRDVQVLLHEAGHAVHAFEASRLPLLQQRGAPMEFNEVASMSLEFLGAPYLTAEQGGFYDAAQAARARVEHLEESLLFWPYMAVVDGFQHWAYSHPDKATTPEHCDAAWRELWARFIPGVDWQGLDDELATGWHRKLHIFQVPFYYVEYGLAQLGAVQVWRNSLRDERAATAAYKQALALGGTASLPELYATAGARFAFDQDTLGEGVALMERTIADLQPVA